MTSYVTLLRHDGLNASTSSGVRIVLVFGLMLAAAELAHGQSSSMHGAPGSRIITLNDTFTFVPPPEPQPIRINDKVTVVVSESASVTSEGEVEQRKRANLDAALEEWVKLDGFSLKSAPQSGGDPSIKAALNSQFRAESELETTSGMRFRIAARVVDIRPNGNLVLEAHKHIVDNEEVWEQRLTGEVAPADVLPNNTVLSENVVQLHIEKRERGQVRDGYKRGWLQRLYDRFLPF